MTLSEITGQVVEAATKVHAALGPGLVESAYEICLLHELKQRGLKLQSDIDVPLVYGDLTVDVGLRIGLLVEETVVVELKAVDEISPVHRAQVLTCLKLSGKRAGLLVNFNVVKLPDGVTRMIN